MRKQLYRVHLQSLTGTAVRGWWYCPRTGQLTHIGKIDKAGSPITFTPPFDGPDWVLVLEDATQFDTAGEFALKSISG